MVSVFKYGVFSLNYCKLAGKAPDTTRLEIQSILAFIIWIGRDVKREVKLLSNTSEKLPFLDRAADPAKGKAVFQTTSQSCYDQ